MKKKIESKYVQVYFYSLDNFFHLRDPSKYLIWKWIILSSTLMYFLKTVIKFSTTKNVKLQFLIKFSYQLSLKYIYWTKSEIFNRVFRKRIQYSLDLIICIILYDTLLNLTRRGTYLIITDFNCFNNCFGALIP